MKRRDDIIYLSGDPDLTSEERAQIASMNSFGEQQVKQQLEDVRTLVSQFATAEPSESFVQSVTKEIRQAQPPRKNAFAEMLSPQRWMLATACLVLVAVFVTPAPESDELSIRSALLSEVDDPLLLNALDDDSEDDDDWDYDSDMDLQDI